MNSQGNERILHNARRRRYLVTITVAGLCDRRRKRVNAFLSTATIYFTLLNGTKKDDGRRESWIAIYLIHDFLLRSIGWPILITFYELVGRKTWKKKLEIWLIDRKNEIYIVFQIS